MATSLTSIILALGTGKHTLDVDGKRFVLYYDEAQAIGDNGKPVKGDKTGEWEVFLQPHPGEIDPVGLKEIGRCHVSPHGTGRHGNDMAPLAAAGNVAGMIERALYGGIDPATAAGRRARIGSLTAVVQTHRN